MDAGSSKPTVGAFRRRLEQVFESSVWLSNNNVLQIHCPDLFLIRGVAQSGRAQRSGR